jgi:hypothetical protein
MLFTKKGSSFQRVSGYIPKIPQTKQSSAGTNSKSSKRKYKKQGFCCVLENGVTVLSYQEANLSVKQLPKNMYKKSQAG